MGDHALGVERQLYAPNQVFINNTAYTGRMYVDAAA
jgi:hypothetical protein